MRIAQGCAGVAVVVPRAVHPVSDRVVPHYMDDTLARKHPHHLRAQCIRTGVPCWLATNLQRSHYSKIVPDILVASRLRHSWRVVHLLELPLDLSCPTRSMDAADAVFHHLRSTSLAD